MCGAQIRHIQAGQTQYRPARRDRNGAQAVVRNHQTVGRLIEMCHHASVACQQTHSGLSQSDQAAAVRQKCGVGESGSAHIVGGPLQNQGLFALVQRLVRCLDGQQRQVGAQSGVGAIVLQPTKQLLFCKMRRKKRITHERTQRGAGQGHCQRRRVEITQSLRELFPLRRLLGLLIGEQRQDTRPEVWVVRGQFQQARQHAGRRHAAEGQRLRDPGQRLGRAESHSGQSRSTAAT